MGAVFGLEGDGIGEAAFGTDSIDGRISAEGVTYETTYGTVTLESAGKFTLEGGSNGTAALEALGLKVGTFGGGEDGQFLKDIDISTFEGATAAITAVDNALRSVTSTRADLGAIQNRFESTISNLQITQENLTAANSRIRDADFASESAELSRTQVLQQAGISILAQANQRPQQVLSLLG
ncbi:flagellin [Salinispirillum sp. LH 10-3-1]|uniref:Flagellin n=2 Tax=Salinispirillum sp. LH 10-3-1 TaxID=2952525 RepID=A0AB38YKH4_9GAMM